MDGSRRGNRCGVRLACCSFQPPHSPSCLTSSTSSPRLWSSRTSTLNDSGRPGCSGTLPLTIASYTRERPSTSSDLTVNSSCSVYAAPYASSAQTSISPNRWPPNCALPPRGCWVIIEYGPVERAWILSSTRCSSLRMYVTPTATGSGNGSPERPSNILALPVRPTSWLPSRLASVASSRPVISC